MMINIRPMTAKLHPKESPAYSFIRNTEAMNKKTNPKPSKTAANIDSMTFLTVWNIIFCEMCTRFFVWSFIASSIVEDIISFIVLKKLSSFFDGMNTPLKTPMAIHIYKGCLSFLKQMRKSDIILLSIMISFIVIIEGCSDIPSAYINTGNDSIHISLEIARTPKEREKGLMFREELDRDKGMLFVFDDEAPRSFWMKNTLIPLDMMFIDSEKKIIKIIENAQPCRNDPCRHYSSEIPAMYVLEMNSGFVRKNNIKEEDRIIFDYK